MTDTIECMVYLCYAKSPEKEFNQTDDTNELCAMFAKIKRRKFIHYRCH